MASSRTTVLKDGTVLTWNETTKSIHVLPKASVVITDDRISAIVENDNDLQKQNVPSDAEIVDVSGQIVSPGFINTHFHAWQSIFRSIAPNTTLSEYLGWLAGANDVAPQHLRPDDIYIGTLQGFLEGLSGGVTTVVDHAHHNWAKDVVRPGYEGAVDSGARVFWCYDVSPRRMDQFPVEEQHRILADIAEHHKAHPSVVSLGIGFDGRGGAASADDELQNLKTLREKFNLQVLTGHHLGDPWPAQAVSSPVAVGRHKLHTAGLPIILSHCGLMKDEDIHALREHDLNVSITPESEFHYGHGSLMGPFISDHASLGVDTNFTFSGDILTQARMWLQSVRNKLYQPALDKGLLPRENPMTVEQGFLLATRQGGRALKRDDLGVLRVGAKADVVVFNGDSPNMLGWSNAIAAVMLHANPGDIQHVLVDGQFRKRDFKLVPKKLDWAQISKRFLETTRRVQPLLSTPPPLPEKLWGMSEFGDVKTATTIDSFP